jgi:hypothetical protein
VSPIIPEHPSEAEADEILRLQPTMFGRDIDEPHRDLVERLGGLRIAKHRYRGDRRADGPDQRAALRRPWSLQNPA